MNKINATCGVRGRRGREEAGGHMMRKAREEQVLEMLPLALLKTRSRKKVRGVA